MSTAYISRSRRPGFVRCSDPACSPEFGPHYHEAQNRPSTQKTDDWWTEAKKAEVAREHEREVTARSVADRIFMLNAQYQGGIIKAKDRDDFIDRYIVPILMGKPDRRSG